MFLMWYNKGKRKETSYEGEKLKIILYGGIIIIIFLKIMYTEFINIYLYAATESIDVYMYLIHIYIYITIV